MWVLNEKTARLAFWISQGYFYRKQQKTKLADASKIRNCIGRLPGYSRSQRRMASRRAGAGLLRGPWSLQLVRLCSAQTIPWPTCVSQFFFQFTGRESLIGLRLVMPSLPRTGSWSALMTLGAHSCIHQGLFPGNGSPEAVTPLALTALSLSGWCGAGCEEKQHTQRSGAALDASLSSPWPESPSFPLL